MSKGNPGADALECRECRCTLTFRLAGVQTSQAPPSDSKQDGSALTWFPLAQCILSCTRNMDHNLACQVAARNGNEAFKGILVPRFSADSENPTCLTSGRLPKHRDLKHFPYTSGMSKAQVAEWMPIWRARVHVTVIVDLVCS